MRIINSLGALKEYRAAASRESGFERCVVPVSEQDEWSYRNGALSHLTGGFFHVTGLDDPVRGAPQLCLYQPQSALNGLALTCREGRYLALVHARVEPGNTGIVQIAPTVQSTAANYLRFHGGNPTTGLDYFLGFHPEVSPLGLTYQFDLTAFYAGKLKSASLVELSAPLAEEIPLPDSFAWVELPVLAAAREADFLLNTDLRAMLATHDWDRGSITGPALSIAGLPSAERGLQFVPLDRLADWNVSDSGILDQAQRGRSVRMHSVRTTSREVSAWFQPLLETATSGLVRLETFGGGAEREFLVTMRREPETFANPIVEASFVRYAGEPVPAVGDPPRGTVVRRLRQSEEGGRFLNVEHVYEICQLETRISPGPDQIWIDRAGLVGILTSSARASASLRVLASLVLDWLHPRTFSGGV